MRSPYTNSMAADTAGRLRGAAVGAGRGRPGRRRGRRRAALVAQLALEQLEEAQLHPARLVGQGELRAHRRAAALLHLEQLERAAPGDVRLLLLVRRALEHQVARRL